MKLDSTASKMQIRSRAFNLGPKFSLDEVYTFEELDIKDIPMTSLNKVKKQQLRSIVLHHRQNREANSFIPLLTVGDNLLVQALMSLWEDMTGHRPSVAESITHSADSILLLRYCDAVFRSCGQRMYLQDVVQHDTIEKQVAILRGRMTNHKTFQSADACVSDPKVADTVPRIARQRNPVTGRLNSNSRMTNIICASAQYSLVPDRVKFRSSAEEKLEELGLGRSVVEDTIPIRQSLYRTILGQRPQSYHMRMVFRVHHAGVQQIIRGTERALASHTMLRSILLQNMDGIPEHLVIRTDHQLLDALVSTRHVNSEQEAQECWENHAIKHDSSAFMFYCEVISVQATGNRYLSMRYSHSIIDALSVWPWHQDLDRIIDNVNADCTAQTPYKRFAELFSLYEDSSLAKRAVLFHVRRLRGISRLTRAFWPLQRAPGWMISNDEGSDFGVERHRIRKQIWGGKWEENSVLFRFPRVGRVVRLPQIQKLKEQGVEASLFAKCAVFIFNILQTGSSHAILNTWESGRSWPFVPSWIESTLPPAMSIGGPTAQWILNLVQIHDDEPLMEYFQRMAGEFRDVEHHQHAPWQKILEELRDEAGFAEDASFRQAFVWDISLGLASSGGFRQDMKTLEPVARMDWADW